MMYTEVLQDSVINLLQTGKCAFASSCSLTLSPPRLKEFYANLEYFRSRVVLRPQEISNSPEIVRRLGLITINTAIEVDLFGNVNSTHVMGRDLMNGIGGSGDFTRNAHVSIYTCPSVAKGGKISTIVPFVTHLDHSEHSVQDGGDGAWRRRSARQVAAGTRFAHDREMRASAISRHVARLLESLVEGPRAADVAQRLRHAPRVSRTRRHAESAMASVRPRSETESEGEGEVT